MEFDQKPRADRPRARALSLQSTEVDFAAQPPGAVSTAGWPARTACPP